MPRQTVGTAGTIQPRPRTINVGIIACENCGCANVSDSRFCRKCGCEFPLVEREPSAADIKMVEEARRLLTEGRYDQAALVATAVLEENPLCIEAIAVLGDCHEHLGFYSLALKCYKDIMAIDPESKLDMLRVKRLERLVASGEIVVEKRAPKRNSMIGASIAAALLFVSSGSALMVASDLDVPAEPESTQPLIESQPFFPQPPVASNRTDFAPNQQQAPLAAEYQGMRTPEKRSIVAPLMAQSNNPQGSDTLPGISGELNDDVAPVLVNPQDVPSNSAPLAPATQDPLSDPDPTVVKPGPADSGKSRTAIVNVKARKTGDPVSGTEPVEDNSAKIETLIRVARDQFLIGNFEKSADAYEKAIFAGAPPSANLQRLAQCYERLGRKDEAIKAYNRAIDAYEQLDQGDLRVQTQLDICRQAVRILRGA